MFGSKPAKEVLLFDTEKPEGSGDYKEVPISEPSHHHPPSSPSEPSSGLSSSLSTASSSLPSPYHHLRQYHPPSFPLPYDPSLHSYFLPPHSPGGRGNHQHSPVDASNDGDDESSSSSYRHVFDSYHVRVDSPSSSSGSNSSGGGSTGLLEEGTRRDQEKSSKLSGLAISFIVLAAVAILILICFVFAMRRRRDTDATYNTHRISLEKSPYDDTVYVDRKSGTMVDSPTDVHSDGTSPRTITTTAEVNGTTTGANNNNTNTFGSKNTTV